MLSDTGSFNSRAFILLNRKREANSRAGHAPEVEASEAQGVCQSLGDEGDTGLAELLQAATRWQEAQGEGGLVRYRVGEKDEAS